jgi:hypothetical protein
VTNRIRQGVVLIPQLTAQDRSEIEMLVAVCKGDEPELDRAA